MVVVSYGGFSQSSLFTFVSRRVCAVVSNDRRIVAVCAMLIEYDSVVCYYILVGSMGLCGLSQECL